MDLSRATGHTRCRRKCAAARFARRYLKGLREGNLIVIDDISFKNPKTSEFLGVMATLGLSDKVKRTNTKTLIIDSLDNANLVLSSRNVQKTKVTNSFGLNIYDIIYHEKLVVSKSAVEELNDLLDPEREANQAKEAAE